mmetsp:Transcript_662/g.790  ORF Transcript_662/g.790 Transcript_662/m.790 type:complete len:252 (+) Transcript_662:172-927(+)
MRDRKILTIVSLILSVSIIMALQTGYHHHYNSLKYYNTAFRYPIPRQRKSASTILSSLPLEKKNSAENNVVTNENRDIISSNRIIPVSRTIELPFPAEIAFEKFSDITRQAEFSPWLRKVEYINPPSSSLDGDVELGETKWYMGFRGFSITWNSICTTLEPPTYIAWESTTGMKNYGNVVFTENKDITTMNLTMSFVAPRIAVIILRRSKKISNFVSNYMFRPTLENFRDVVAKEVNEEEQHKQEDISIIN